MKKKADVIFVNGSVITIDGNDRVCEAAAVAGNRILHVGGSREVEALGDPDTVVIDLKGRSLLPGFVDAHCHPGLYAGVMTRIQLGKETIRSIEDIKREVRKRAASTPWGEWILGWGFNDTYLKEHRHPTRWDLDEVAPHHRVFLSRTCGHVVVVNSRVLDEFGIDRHTPDPDGGRIERDDRGEPTGVLYETAREAIKEAILPSETELIHGMKIMSRDFLGLGITSAQDASGWDPKEIRLFQRGVAEGWIGIRLYFMVWFSEPEILVGEHFIESGLSTGFGNDRLRLGPCKILMDGSGGGRSAAMRTSYPGDPDNYGILYRTQEDLEERILRAHSAGYQVGIHAIGDRAIEMTLEGYKNVLKVHPRQNHRHRIEHCGFLDDTMMEMIHEQGIVAALGLPFLYELGDNYLDVFGQDRLDCVYPLRSLSKRGIVAPLSSDTPVINPNPMHGIYFAVTRQTKGGHTIAAHEAVNLMHALRAYTLWGAYASFEEGLKGSIEAGKIADMIVLSRNILETPHEEIVHITVDLTMMDGDIVYEKDSSKSPSAG